jgi:hypothetical protein
LSQAHRAQPDPTLPPLPLPAPRVCVHTAEQGQVIQLVARSERLAITIGDRVGFRSQVSAQAQQTVTSVKIGHPYDT